MYNICKYNIIKQKHQVLNDLLNKTEFKEKPPPEQQQQLAVKPIYKK